MSSRRGRLNAWSYVASWVSLALLLVGGDFATWRARRREGVKANLRAAGLLDPKTWPPEPATPSSLVPERFQQALRAVCGPMPASRAENYTRWILANAAKYEEDPFLLGALVVRMSRCLPESHTVEGIGLTSIQPAMVEANVRGRKLVYPVRQADTWITKERAQSVALNERTLEVAEYNIEWAAALLAMFRDQHADIDARFPQQAHRHYVSHFVWGDTAYSARAEDHILTDRRRLLDHYGERQPVLTTTWRGLSWSLPLECGPRVVSSQPGADRDEGLRLHRGVDVESAFGEPVLAMADGRVSFAGIDLPGRAQRTELKSGVARSEMGRGGRFVCITHLDAHEDELWLRSCYMHLEQIKVNTGDVIKRGDIVGTVGRTGMKRSAPHLHLELKSDKRLYDPREVLAGLLIGDPPPDPSKKKRRRRPITAPAFPEPSE
jgi:murein DD-endopeptidase MepM/ murein hydrolase activator NlpD